MYEGGEDGCKMATLSLEGQDYAGRGMTRTAGLQGFMTSIPSGYSCPYKDRDFRNNKINGITRSG